MLRFADVIEQSLFHDLIDHWVPVCVDPAGGYHQSLDANFVVGDDTTKFVVFQGRIIWAMSVLAEAFPERAAEFRPIAEHGIRFFSSQIANADTGALRWWIDAEGKPVQHESDADRDEANRLPADLYRTYGVAFGIYALSAAARCLGNAEALEMAKRAFWWLESCAHDGVNGGYCELVTAEEQPFVLPTRPQFIHDFTNNPYGLKSHNSQLHLLEALAELYRVWPDPLVAERLGEMLELLSVKFIAPQGCSYSALNADLTPASMNCSYGHDIEAAHLILDAGDLLRRDVLPAATGLAEHSLHKGFDSEFDGMYGAGLIEGGPTDTNKHWWVPAEAMLGFATVASRSGNSDYLDAAVRSWNYIDQHHIDHQRGGWYGMLDREGRVQDGEMKGYAWKAIYHETRALLYTARVIRSVATS